MFAEPPPTQGDLHFRVCGFPVRIHPFFWVVAVLLSLRGESLSLRGESTAPAELFSWIAAMLVSIVVHELGHAFLQRHYGGNPRIVLHGLGGLAICGDCDRSTRPQILISLAGPVAGFLFALFLFLLVRTAGYKAGFTLGTPNITGFSMNLLGVKFYWEQLASQHTNNVFGDLMQINIVWGVMNLLPIYPLDGGQVSREVCQLFNARQGIVFSLRISIIAAIGAAILGLASNELFIVLMFGYLAYSSYKTLEAYRSSLW